MFGNEILHCMASSKLPELKKALQLYDVQRKRQQPEAESPATDLTEEMQMNAKTPYHQEGPNMSVILEIDGDADEDEQPMPMHQSARKPHRSRVYRSSDEHSPMTPANQSIPRHSTNSAATIEDTPSPAASSKGRSNFSRCRNLNTGSTDTSLESEDDGTDDEVHKLTEGFGLTVCTHHYNRCHSNVFCVCLISTLLTEHKPSSKISMLQQEQPTVWI